MSPRCQPRGLTHHLPTLQWKSKSLARQDLKLINAQSSNNTAICSNWLGLHLDLVSNILHWGAVSENLTSKGPPATSHCQCGSMGNRMVYDVCQTENKTAARSQPTMSDKSILVVVYWLVAKQREERVAQTHWRRHPPSPASQGTSGELLPIQSQPSSEMRQIRGASNHPLLPAITFAAAGEDRGAKASRDARTNACRAIPGS